MKSIVVVVVSLKFWKSKTVLSGCLFSFHGPYFVSLPLTFEFLFLCTFLFEPWIWCVKRLKHSLAKVQWPLMLAPKNLQTTMFVIIILLVGPFSIVYFSWEDFVLLKWPAQLLLLCHSEKKSFLSLFHFFPIEIFNNFCIVVEFFNSSLLSNEGLYAFCNLQLNQWNIFGCFFQSFSASRKLTH